MATFLANGLITLTTDFGLHDPFVGVMKGAVLSRYPNARIVDLTHALPKFQPQIAGFWLAHCWPYFPAGTIHLAVVDPGVGGERAMRWVLVGEQLFIAPDNGLLDPLMSQSGLVATQVFGMADLACLNLAMPSQTFHGRDVFAPLVAELAAGRVNPAQIGRVQAVELYAGLRREGQSAQGSVIWVDDFGNLFTDLAIAVERDEFVYCIKINSQLIEIKNKYSDVAPGELLALVNAWGVLEIAVNQGNAAQMLSTGAGTAVALVASKRFP